ncbi:LexA family protein [Streptomyces sp. NPDC002073]
MLRLTLRRRRILEAIDARGGLSVREIGTQVGLSSSSSVAHQLSQLERAGWLVRDGRGWRSARLTGTGVRRLEDAAALDLSTRGPVLSGPGSRPSSCGAAPARPVTARTG